MVSQNVNDTPYIPARLGEDGVFAKAEAGTLKRLNDLISEFKISIKCDNKNHMKKPIMKAGF